MKFVLLINGPSCSGKSVVTGLFLEGKQNCFRASMDKIKWLISDYSAEKYSGTGIVNKMLFNLAESAISEGFSLVVEGNVGIMRNWRDRYAELAKENNLSFFEANIEAPYDVLKKRFEERVSNAEKQGTHISVKDEAGMKNRYDAYMSLRNQNLPTFDSSVLSSEQIVSEVNKLIG